MDLKKVFFKGTFWGAANSVIQAIVTIGLTIVLSRLLTPKDYGISSVALAASGIFVVLSEMGFAQALIAEKNVQRRMIDSVFWFQVLSGIVLSFVLWLSAPAIANFYHIPELTSVVQVTSWGIFFSLSCAVPRALLQKNLQFKSYNIIQVIGLLVSSVYAIYLAVKGYGYWALVLPPILMNIVYTVLSFSALRYWPKFTLALSDVRATAKFGISVLGTNVLHYLINNGVQLVMAKTWTPHLVGIYNFASKRSQQPYQIFNGFFGAVVFPVLSTISSDIPRLKRSIFKLTRVTQHVTFPLYAVLIVYADKLIPWLFGSQWVEAVLPFQILSAFIILRTYSIGVSNAYYALKRPQEGFRNAVLRFIFWFPAMIMLLYFHADLVTVTICAFSLDLVISTIYSVRCYRMLGMTWHEFTQELAVPFQSLIIMLLVIFIGTKIFVQWGSLNIAQLGISMVLALGMYFVLAWAEIKDVFMQIKQSMRVA